MSGADEPQRRPARRLGRGTRIRAMVGYVDVVLMVLTIALLITATISHSISDTLSNISTGLGA